jgi:hypothetical protein
LAGEEEECDTPDCRQTQRQPAETAGQRRYTMTMHHAHAPGCLALAHGVIVMVMVHADHADEAVAATAV